MVQPWDYIHKSGTAGLTLQNYAARFASSTGAPSTNPNVILAQPFFTGDLPLDLAGAGIYCSATGTGKQRLAIYGCTGVRNIYPTTKLYDLGELTYAATGARLAALAMTLPAGGLFWLATLADGGTGSHYSTDTSNPISMPSGVLGSVPFSGVNPPNIVGMCFEAARTYALGMPASFPAGATIKNPNSLALPAIVLDPT